MKLLTLNVSDERFISLAKKMSDGKGDEVLFVDWSSTKYPDNAEEMSNSLMVISSAPKDVKIVVFDRHCEMTNEEVSYFLKRGAILLEPSMSPRLGFRFMPYWINRIDLPLSTWDRERNFDLGYKGDTLTKSCESLLVRSVKNIPGISVGVSVSNHISKDRFDVIKDIMTVSNIKWGRFKCCVVSDDNFQRIPDISNHLKYGVVPLISDRYSWYHAVFKNFIVNDIRDIGWYIKMYDTCHYGFMEEIYKNITNHMPEMYTENFIEAIVSLVSK